MRQFLKYTGEFLRTYPQIRLNSNDESLIRNECIKHLGLNNMGQLRDRYEGQDFFDKTLKNIGSVLSIQRHHELPNINPQRTDIGGYKPTVEINGVIFDIIVFEFGTLPLVNTDELDKPVYFVVQKDRITFSLCGIATAETIKNNLITTSIEKSTYTNYMEFTGFKFLTKPDIK